MDAVDPCKLCNVCCPTFAERFWDKKSCLYCWGMKDLVRKSRRFREAESLHADLEPPRPRPAPPPCRPARPRAAQMYLGMGTTLYLNFLRWMSLTFLCMGLITTFSAYRNAAQQDRYTLQTLPLIEYAATHSSIANVGGGYYTPGGVDYCSRNGFASTVCERNGWGLNADYSKASVGTAWAYECGAANDTIAGYKYNIASWIFGGVSAHCQVSSVICLCLPGYFGAHCESRCPANVSSAAASAGPASVLDCNVCAPGFYGVVSNPGTASAAGCSACPAGTYSSSDRLSCIACPTGITTANSQTGSASVAACTMCAPGYAGTVTNGGTVKAAGCSQCPAGTYAGAGAQSCSSCPAGFTTSALQPGRASVTDCAVCAPGYAGTPSGAGTAGASGCNACSAGGYAPAPGLQFCLSCDAGSYSAAPGASSCSSCPAGITTTPGLGAASQAVTDCTTCAAGFYGSVTGAGTSAAAGCTACPVGITTTQLATGSRNVSSCTDCAPGFFGVVSNAGSAAAAGCAACPAGSVSAVGAQACTTCPAGTYAAAGGVSCTACPAGTAAPAGSTSCQVCPAGTSAARRSGSCTPCAPGFIAPATGSASCLFSANLTGALVAAQPLAPPLRGWCRPPKIVDPCATKDSLGNCVPGSATAPLIDWWAITDVDLRYNASKAVALLNSDPAYCSGRGACQVRTPDNDVTNPLYGFCMCNEGFFGTQCEFSDKGLTSGSYYNYGYSKSDADQCNKGKLPRISNAFFTTQFPAMLCQKHGVGLALPTLGGGLLDKSNFFRVQTSSTCFCEPGFDGEECMGGAPVPDGEGWVHGALSMVLLISITVIYRDRRRMMKAYRVESVTAKDYSVFVNYLPMVHISEIGLVYKHFEQWGPVHIVSPALADSVATGYQKEKNTLMLYQRIMRENEMYLRKLEVWKRSCDTLREQGKLDVLARLEKEKPGVQSAEAGPVERATAEPGDAGAALKPLSTLDWITAYANANPMAPGLFSTRGFLYRYRLYLDSKIKREVENPDVRRFARAFVTFKDIGARNRCLAAYSERRQGMFGVLPDFDPKILFRGKEWISVEPAAEPEEVNWSALGTGPRVRAFLVLSGLLLLVGLVLALFYLVLVTNASQATGIVGLLISLSLVVINILMAFVWAAAVEFERHPWVGNAVRSQFFKTLITQIFVTVLAGTLGVYGFPINQKNGYIQDWYATAGGFLFRQVIMETLVPPIMDFLDIPTYMNQFFSAISVSAAEKQMFSRPLPPNLAMRCASLIRTIIMCCAFNAGLPVLNLGVAVAIIARYYSDKFCYTEIFAVMRYGPELARSLELMLMFAAAVQVVTGWVTLNAGWENNFITLFMFYLGVIGTMWAVMGYFSYRWFRGLDCWGGSGPVLPCTGWLCCFNDRVLAPFQAVHKAFMTLVFGVEFFEQLEKKAESMEKQATGVPYEMAIRTRNLRRQPYSFYERGQIFPELDAGDKAPFFETAREFRARVATQKFGGTGDDMVRLTTSPLLLQEKAARLKQAAAKRAGLVGIAVPAAAIVENPLARSARGAGAGAARAGGAAGSNAAAPLPGALALAMISAQQRAAPKGRRPPPPDWHARNGAPQFEDAWDALHHEGEHEHHEDAWDALHHDGEHEHHDDAWDALHHEGEHEHHEDAWDALHHEGEHEHHEDAWDALHEGERAHGHGQHEEDAW